MVVENLDTQDQFPKYRMSKGKESYNSVHIALETIKKRSGLSQVGAFKIMKKIYSD